jgi:cytidyltransferase-like protein
MPFVVYVDMVGDLFHAGHVGFLRKARELGAERAAARDESDVRLVVGLMGDDAAAAYKRRPVQPLAQRIVVVEACRYVDDVVGDPPMPVSEAFLAEQAVDLVVHGDDLGDEDLRYWYSVPIAQGRFAVVPYTKLVGGEPVSTSAIIRRVEAGEPRPDPAP